MAERKAVQTVVNPTVKAECPPDYTGERVLVECHKCGMGIGSTLGQIAIPTEMRELLDKKLLSCPHCGMADLTAVRMDERVKEQMDNHALKAANAALEADRESLQAQVAELQRRLANQQPAPAEPGPDSRAPRRGQHGGGGDGLRG
jgi:Zn finger protein HypA/HybF involved in hydrogenase expression